MMISPIWWGCWCAEDISLKLAFDDRGGARDGGGSAAVEQRMSRRSSRGCRGGWYEKRQQLMKAEVDGRPWMMSSRLLLRRCGGEEALKEAEAAPLNTATQTMTPRSVTLSLKNG